MTLRLEHSSEEEARAVLAAIEPDNGPHCSASLDGRAVVITAESDKPMSLVHTAEDLLACVKAAQQAAAIKGA